MSRKRLEDEYTPEDDYYGETELNLRGFSLEEFINIQDIIIYNLEQEYKDDYE